MAKHIDAEMEEIERLCEAKRKGLPMPKKEAPRVSESQQDSLETVAPVQSKKPMNLFVKILIGILATISIIVVLAILYQVLEFLFVAAILLIAWIGPRGRWWR